MYYVGSVDKQYFVGGQSIDTQKLLEVSIWCTVYCVKSVH